jgi:hypothetical protein
VLGVKVHDARLVAAMNVHGVGRILTFDVDDFAKAAEPGAPLRKVLPAEPLFLVDRGSPYGWVEGPPSLNRLIGALWLASCIYPAEISFSADDARTMNVALVHRFPTDPTINEMIR